MRIGISPLFFLFATLAFAQDGFGVPYTSSDYIEVPGGATLSLVNRKDRSNQKTVEGSPYLYKSWANDGDVYFEEKVYKFNLFNYNVYAERFEAKVSEDSVYIINPRGVDKVVMHNRVFRRFLDPEFQRNSYFEEMMTSKDLQLFRKYYAVLREPNVNPLTKVPEGLPKLLMHEDFYVLKTDNEKLEKIKFRKKSILNLISENQQKLVQSYVKENNLKYNNLHDIVTILKYYITLSA